MTFCGYAGRRVDSFCWESVIIRFWRCCHCGFFWIVLELGCDLQGRSEDRR